MKKVLKILVKIICVIVVLVTIPNYNSLVYRFGEPKKFEGNQFYNPYENLNDNWIKVNFHAHAKAYGGISLGENSAEEMLAKYDSLGYELACISNYGFVQDSIAGNKYMPVYEHGFNLGWIHQLVINETDAKPFDYPFYQNLSTKQFMIDRLKTENNLIVLNHPNHKKAYRTKDLKYLNNYDLIEGISEFAKSIKQWDTALSFGHAVWVVGNDDSHDLSDYHVGLAWNMINVESTSNSSILESLKAGKTYATKGWLGQEMNRIKNLTVEDGYYKLKMQQKSDSIKIISDNGQVVSIATSVDSISYKIKPENTYLRTEIFETEPWNGYTMMYLNPVIRTKDRKLIPHNNKNEVSYFLSILYWLTLLLIQSVLSVIVIKW